MAVNTITSVKTPSAILLGLGILGIRALPLGSPPAAFADIGYIKGCGISYNRELRNFESGGVLIKQLVFRDTFSMNVTAAEVNIATLNKLIPSTLSNATPGTNNRITFGGGRVITEYNVLFEHTRSDGKIIQIEVFKSIVGGEVTLNFAEEEFITYPVNFTAQADESKTVGQQYARITLVD